MTDENDSKDKKDSKKPQGSKNPWGNTATGKDSGKVKAGPWSGAGHSGGTSGQNHNSGGIPQKDLEDMIRRAQKNFNTVMPGGGEGKGLPLLLLIGAALLWLASGFYIVNPGEHAVIQRFGQWSRTKAEPGLGYHMPAPVERATILNVAELRRMNIGFIDSMGRASDARRDIAEESLMLTSDRNIVDIDLVIQWNIKSAEDYLFNILDQENTIKKVAESAVREIVGQTNMFPIITNQRQAVADRTKEILQKNLDQYNSGVNITNVLIEKAEVHPEVQDAFQDVQSAKQDAEDVKNRAGAYREDILPKARGEAIKALQDAEAYRQSVIARASGDADRFNAVYEAYLTGQDVTKERMYIETMESVMGNARKIIMDGQSSKNVVPYLPLDTLKQEKKDK